MRARLFVDGSSVPPFGSSFAVVAHLLRARMEARGWAVDERVLPLPTLEEYRAGTAPAPFAVPAADAAMDLFFEEVFLRARWDSAAERARATVFFNLMCFDEASVANYAGVRALVFNSSFLARSFWARWHARPRASEQGGPPSVWALPLVLPELVFEGGYASGGEDVDERLLDELRAVPLAGHALRPHKLDPLAVVAIARNLVAGASAAAVRLVLPEADREAILAVAEHLGFRRAARTCLVFVPRLHNRGLLRLMRACRFGLAHDRAIEAFGFYALESVFAGSALFTNGAGNLRHLLPRGHGVHVYDHPALYTRDARALLEAYRPVAEAIAAARPDDGGLAVGRALIEARYGPATFAARFSALVEGRADAAEAPAEAQVHPAVRGVVDGVVLTDDGPVALEAAERGVLEALMAGESVAAAEVPRALVERRLVVVAPPCPTGA